MITTPNLSRRKLLGIGAAIPTLAGLPLGFLGDARANDQPAVGGDPFVAGSYLFNIGAFKATVVSDGYGCQSLLCLDLVSFPVLSQIKPQAPVWVPWDVIPGRTIS